MILAYQVLSTLIYPFLVIFIYFRKIIKKEDPLRYKEKILPSHFNVTKKENLKLIWFHATSIGELKSIIPILEEINFNKKKVEFLITTTTLSSGNIAIKELKKFNNIHHRYFPLDINFLINQFLNLWKPNAIFLVDSEIWPNLIFKINEKKIPLALINGRITSKTYKKWMLFPKTARKIFKLFDLCLVSNAETKNYLKDLDAKNIFFYGNIKLISTIDKNKISNRNEEILLKNKFWLAASTHKGEDKMFLDTHLKLKNEYNDIITIIAPRHIDRSQEIKTLSENYNLNTQILNENETISKNKEIVILNSFGILHNYFKYAKSVFIGKSTLKKLRDVGGQNPIDAARLGCKIYHGPYVYNFKEIYELLEKNNVSKKINNFNELSSNLIKDLKYSQKEGNKISSLINNLGQKILTDTMKKINYFLLNEIK